jgi:hypothetical protein
VVGFFGGGMQQVLPVVLIASQRRLAKIQRLRADLTGVVDAHQAGGMASLRIIEVGFNNALSGRGALRGGRTGHSLEGVVTLNQKAIKRSQCTNVHGNTSQCKILP